jgi:hypothetical protein
MAIKKEVKAYNIFINTNVLLATIRLHMRKTLLGSLAQMILTQFTVVDPISSLITYTKIYPNIDILM